MGTRAATIGVHRTTSPTFPRRSHSPVRLSKGFDDDPTALRNHCIRHHPKWRVCRRCRAVRPPDGRSPHPRTARGLCGTSDPASAESTLVRRHRLDVDGRCERRSRRRTSRNGNEKKTFREGGCVRSRMVDGPVRRNDTFEDETHPRTDAGEKRNEENDATSSRSRISHKI